MSYCVYYTDDYLSQAYIYMRIRLHLIILYITPLLHIDCRRGYLSVFGYIKCFILLFSCHSG